MGHVIALEIQALWKILVVGLVLGAGLPVLFSVGIRAMAPAAGEGLEAGTLGGHAAARHPTGRILSTLCFAAVAVCVLLALTYIVAAGFGKVLSFDHVYPTIVSKS